MLETTSGSDQNVASSSQFRLLNTDLCATVDNDTLQDGIVGEFASFLVDLSGKLTGRSQNDYFRLLSVTSNATISVLRE